MIKKRRKTPSVQKKKAFTVIISGRLDPILINSSLQQQLPTILIASNLQNLSTLPNTLFLKKEKSNAVCLKINFGTWLLFNWSEKTMAQVNFYTISTLILLGKTYLFICLYVYKLFTLWLTLSKKKFNSKDPSIGLAGVFWVWNPNDL